ncbi:MAG TPA: hypothetical protein PLV92_17640 [Pirellulaceae bacterium]|nr:hypothetical protein [Pirellulaceae bacterium]
MTDLEPLARDDVELLAAAFAGDLDADEIHRRLAEAPGRARRLAAIATGLTRTAAETLAPYRDVTSKSTGEPTTPVARTSPAVQTPPTALCATGATPIVDDSASDGSVATKADVTTPLERQVMWRRRVWLSAAAALLLLASAVSMYEFGGGPGDIDRRNIAYSLAPAQVRGANDSKRHEWVVRVERSSPAIAYVVRMVDGVPSLEQGQLSLPAQQRYVLTPTPEASQYHLLLLDPNGPTGRDGVERILRDLGKCGPEWVDRLGASLAAAREPWFAVAEIELPGAEQ